MYVINLRENWRKEVIFDMRALGSEFFYFLVFARSLIGPYNQMYHYFIYKHDEFLEHYHKRSNVESYFNMVKTKLGDDLKSKKQMAQINELLCKILANNIMIVIQEIAEFKIEQTKEVSV